MIVQRGAGLVVHGERTAFRFRFLNNARNRLAGISRVRSAFSMDDSVQIKCTRCKNVFRDRARRLQNGYSRQCTACEVVIFFDEDSQTPNIKQAMRTARRIRKELRELEAAATFSKSSSGSGSSRLRSHRGRSQGRSEED
jgi:hypothetical protein